MNKGLNVSKRQVQVAGTQYPRRRTQYIVSTMLRRATPPPRVIIPGNNSQAAGPPALCCLRRHATIHMPHQGHCPIRSDPVRVPRMVAGAVFPSFLHTALPSHRHVHAHTKKMNRARKRKAGARAITRARARALTATARARKPPLPPLFRARRQMTGLKTHHQKTHRHILAGNTHVQQCRQ